MKKITIKDIARLTGVSPTAVSFVINNREGVGDETRLKVQQAIEKTGFIPNIHTRRLNLKKSFNIQLALKQYANPLANIFYMEILMGILHEGMNYGYNIVITDISDEKREEVLLNNIRNNDADGVIFIQDADQSIYSKISEFDIPFIVVDTQETESPYPVVRVDYQQAAFAGVKYLISKGHQKIAYMGIGSNPGFYFNTFEGYKSALESENLMFYPPWIQHEANDEASTIQCIERILNSASLPTAVFCASDIIAICAMKHTTGKGFKIPDDISFFGMDDIILSKYTTPRLSTIKFDEHRMGRTAMQQIIKLIKDKPSESITLPSNQIIERESVKDLKAEGRQDQDCFSFV